MARPAVKRLVKILDGTLVTNTSYDKTLRARVCRYMV